MKIKLAVFLIIVLMIGGSVFAQIGNITNPVTGVLSVQDGGTCSTANSYVTQQLPVNASTTTVNLAGTFSATLTVRESNNGGASWTTAGTLSSAGTSTYSTNGFSHLCVDLTAYTSGNIQVSISTGLLQVQSVVSGGSSSVSSLKGVIDATIAGQGFTPATGGARWVSDAVLTVSSPTVTSATAGWSAATDQGAGHVIWCTSGGSVGGGQVNGVLNVPKSSITVVNATTVTAGSNASANATGASCAFGVDNDDVGLNAAWTQTGSKGGGPCGTVLLSSSFIVENAVFVSTPACNNAQTGGSSRGMQVMGWSRTQNQLLIAPTFVTTSCTGVLQSCVGGVQGTTLMHFGVFGLNYCNVPNPGSLISVFGLTTDTYIYDVLGEGWACGVADTNVMGVRLGTVGEIVWYGVFDAIGNVTCRNETGSGSVMTDTFCGDSYAESLIIMPNSSLQTKGGGYGITSKPNGAIVHNFGIWWSNHERIAGYGGNAQVAVQTEPGGGTTNITYLDGMNFGMTGNASSTGLYCPATGTSSTVYSRNGFLQGGSSNFAVFNTASSNVCKFHDQGGNTFVNNVSNGAGSAWFTDTPGSTFGGTQAGIAPTCAATTGGTACSLVAGSTNEKGTVRITASAVATGTVTLTYAGTFAGATNTTPSCHFDYANTGTGAWSLTATTPIVLTTRSTTAPVINWNQTGALTAASTYDIDYTCWAR